MVFSQFYVAATSRPSATNLPFLVILAAGLVLGFFTGASSLWLQHGFDNLVLVPMLCPFLAYAGIVALDASMDYKGKGVTPKALTVFALMALAGYCLGLLLKA